MRWSDAKALDIHKVETPRDARSEMEQIQKIYKETI